MKTRDRMGEAAISQLRGIAEARPGLRDPVVVEACLRRACGFGVEADGHHWRVVRIPDGVVVPERGEGAREAASEAGRALVAWLADGPSEWIGPRRRLPMGARDVLPRVGVRIGALLDLHRALTCVQVETALGSVLTTMRGATLGVRIDTPSGLRWENGNVVLRSRPIPGMAAVALAGRPLSELVSDDAIGDRRIRHVPRGEAREGLVRIATTDQGRWEVIGEEN